MFALKELQKIQAKNKSIICLGLDLDPRRMPSEHSKSIKGMFEFAGIPWTSIFIDTINMAIIVFAAILIRQKARELTVIESSSFGEFLLDLISLPLAKIGQWFAAKWKQINFVSVFLTAIVDTPIAKFIKVIEDWRNYLKDKQSGIH